MSERVLAPALVDGGEEELERTLRPGSLARVRRPGARQGAARDRARRGAAAAARRSTTSCSPARRVSARPRSRRSSAASSTSAIRQVAGPALERKGDIAAILTALEPRDVLFVDEIHRLNRAVEEILYPALEDFRLDIIVGQGPAARTLTLDLPPFTLVGATTRTGLLTTPLRDRFGLTFRLDHYSPDELGAIVRRSARILDVEIEPDAAEEIARRARGTPRIANRILRRVRDVAEVRHAGAITTAIADEALELLEIDGSGLERFDRELLAAIAVKFGGGPVGLSTLAVVARRGGRDDRGRLRALPAPARLHPADAARPRAHRPRARPGRMRRPPLGLDALLTPCSKPALTDIFVLKRVAAGRFVHLGGAGRGEGWAGIVEVALESEADLDRALRGDTIVRIDKPGTRSHLRAVLRAGGGDRAPRAGRDRRLRIARRDDRGE